MMAKARPAALRILAALALGVALTARPATARPLRVVVSILPQRAIVEAVGGKHLTVEVLVGPGRNIHTYEPTPRQMVAMAEADLVLPIGVPFELAWLPRLREATPDLPVLDLLAAAGVERLPLIGHSHAEHALHEDGQAEEELDPHIWTDPRLVARLLPPLAAALAAADSAHAAEYAANADRFAAELAALDGEIRGLLAGFAGRRFLVFHPSWGYFAAAYGLVQVAIEQDGKEPGARSLTGIIARARAEGIRVIFVQQQSATASAEAVAEAVGGRVVALDPLAPDYVENLRRSARIIAEALRSAP
jgi:zinc transport system substrate-binding protein